MRDEEEGQLEWDEVTLEKLTVNLLTQALFTCPVTSSKIPFAFESIRLQVNPPNSRNVYKLYLSSGKKFFCNEHPA